MESYGELVDFVGTVARRAALSLSSTPARPGCRACHRKENREIPPLNYPWVYRLKQDFPRLTIVINGGIQSLDDCRAHLSNTWTA